MNQNLQSRAAAGRGLAPKNSRATRLYHLLTKIVSDFWNNYRFADTKTLYSTITLELPPSALLITFTAPSLAGYNVS